MADWQYVEETSTLRGDFASVDLRYWLNNASQVEHGFYVSSGFDRLVGQLSYDYNRFKPYNGAVCIGSCLEKVSEENATGESTVTTTFLRLGTGYVWRLGENSRIGTFALLAGVRYLKNLDSESSRIGTVRQALLSTDFIAPMTAHGGLIVRF